MLTPKEAIQEHSQILLSSSFLPESSPLWENGSDYKHGMGFVQKNEACCPQIVSIRKALISGVVCWGGKHPLPRLIGITESYGAGIEPALRSMDEIMPIRMRTGYQPPGPR